MEYKIKSVSGLIHELSLNLPAETVQVEINEHLKELRKRVSIPGFRKGKVPLDLVKARYTKDVESDVFNDLINKNFQEIMKSEDFNVIGGGIVKSIDWKADESLKATIEFQVVPQIELKKIDKLKVVKEVQKVSNGDIEKTIERLREQHAVIKPIENGAHDGHFILADFQEIDKSGVPIIGKKLADQSFRLGSGVFGKIFDEQMLGVKNNEERSVQVSFHAKPGEEKKEYYKVTVKKIEEQILPELDDDFAQSVGNFKNTEELKVTLSEQLENEFNRRSQEKLHNNLIDEFIKNNPLEVPPLIIDNYLDAWFEDIKKESKGELKEEELKEQNRPFALRNLKWHMLKDELIKQENLKVGDADIENKLNEIAENSQIDLGELRKHYRDKKNRDELVRNLEEKRVFDRLLETAKVEETKVSKQKSNLIQTV